MDVSCQSHGRPRLDTDRESPNYSAWVLSGRVCSTQSPRVVHLSYILNHYRYGEKKTHKTWKLEVSSAYLDSVVERLLCWLWCVRWDSWSSRNGVSTSRLSCRTWSFPHCQASLPWTLFNFSKQNKSDNRFVGFRNVLDFLC